MSPGILENNPGVLDPEAPVRGWRVLTAWPVWSLVSASSSSRGQLWTGRRKVGKTSVGTWEVEEYAGARASKLKYSLLLVTSPLH